MEIAKVYKVDLSFTMKEMEDYLLYKVPTNYRWKDKDNHIMTVGDGTEEIDIQKEFEKNLKQTLLNTVNITMLN
jgi:hypothetical protein